MLKTRRKRGLALLIIIFLLLTAFVIGKAAGALDRVLDKIYGEDRPGVTELVIDSLGGKKKNADLLTLVNPWHSLPVGYEPELDTLSDGTAVDARSIDDLRELLTACREAGCAPYICSAYRTHEYQQGLFEAKVESLVAVGYNEEEARTEAGRSVAVPGTSEHELGLAVDIIDSANSALDESQAATPTQVWLMENSWRYGWILRYPEGKSHITGIIFEPWHYRYVGKDAAAEIFASGMTLEEYLGE